MGTRGHYLYRWRGWYFVHYQNSDAYPEGLGLEVLGKVPPADCDPADFKKWLTELEGRLEDDLKKSKTGEWRRGKYEVNDDYYICHEQPGYDVFIEWSYEIDLDNLVFHINRNPIFRLDCMPPSDDFCRFISWDHYGGQAYAENMPKCHRPEVNWHPSPPEIGDDQLEAYKRLEASMTVKGDISPLPMSVVSRTRIRLLEVKTLRKGMIHDTIFDLHHFTSRDSFTEKCLSTLYTFAFTTLSSCKYGPLWEDYNKDLICGYPAKVSKGHSLAIRLRKNLCVFAWTHLYDEHNLKAAVAAVTACLRSQSHTSDSFGVALSVFHCVIVKLEGGTGKVSHTGALDFLPSRYAYSPTTTGITALARLSEYLDHLCLGHPDVEVWTTEPLHTPLPLEVLTQISEHILDLPTLLAYARASVQTRTACKAMLMKPWVEDLQLIAVHPNSVLDDDSDTSGCTNEDLNGNPKKKKKKKKKKKDLNGDDDEAEDEDEGYFDFLYKAKFFTQILDRKHPDSVFTLKEKYSLFPDDEKDVFEWARRSGDRVLW